MDVANSFISPDRIGLERYSLLRVGRPTGIHFPDRDDVDGANSSILRNVEINCLERCNLLRGGLFLQQGGNFSGWNHLDRANSALFRRLDSYRLGRGLSSKAGESLFFLVESFHLIEKRFFELNNLLRFRTILFGELRRLRARRSEQLLRQLGL